MKALAPWTTGRMAREAIGMALEIALILVILCLLAAIAGVWLIRPGVETDLGKARAVDLLMSMPVPAVPGETCGSLVKNAGQANSAAVTWEASASNKAGFYLVTVIFERGSDRAIFHWTVDTSHRSIQSLEERSICQLP